MNKTPVLLATLLFPVLGAALVAQSCSGGESIGSSTIMGNGSGGTNGTGTGGSGSPRGTGGTSSGNSSGGSSVSTGSGGAPITGGGTGGGIVVIGGGTGGSSVIIGGGTGGTAVVGTGSLVALNGFVTSGPWHGYAFTSTSGMTNPPTTIAPLCDAAGTAPCFKAAGAQLCAMGSVAMDTTFNSTAGLGFNVNQLMSTSAASPVTGSVATSGLGLLISVSAFVPGMRVQVQNSTGVQWCAPLIGPTTMVPWGMFNTMCYLVAPPPAGALAVGAPIQSVGIVIPSLAASAVPFNFCLTDARPYP
jgi:hypothetical protein